MATNFRTSVNTFFDLSANATATERKDALRSATLDQLTSFCRTQPNAQQAWAAICGLIAPEPWDIEIDLTKMDCKVVWGAEPICIIPLSVSRPIDEAIERARKVAVESLDIWFNTCYPPCVSDVPPYEFKHERDLIAGYCEGRFILDGLDKYSALGGLVDYERWLDEEELRGPASAYEGATLFEIGEAA